MYRSIPAESLLILLPLFLLGCTATTYRLHPRFKERFEQSRTVAIIQPQMKICRLTAGGVSEFMYEWSMQSGDLASKLLSERLAGLFAKRVAFIDPLDLDGEGRDFIDSQIGMFFTVSSSVVEHDFKRKKKRAGREDQSFRYTLGPEVSRLKEFAPDADLFLFCAAQKSIWTPGRVSMAVVNGLVGFFMPVGSDWMALAVIDADTGDVLWFDYVNKPGDLRDQNVLDKILTKVFYHLSETRSQGE
ncbi:MAG: hypothetical protein AB1650_04225 [Candidatus Omnitrophota bacterium]